jgi:hypothetical protein
VTQGGLAALAVCSRVHPNPLFPIPSQRYPQRVPHISTEMMGQLPYCRVWKEYRMAALPVARSFLQNAFHQL